VSDHLDHRVPLAKKDSQALLDQKAHLGQRVSKDMRALLDQWDRKETGAVWACLDSLASMVYLAYKAHQVHLDHPVWMDVTARMATLVCLDAMGNLAHLVSPACPVAKAKKENHLR